ncbi:hypothetical protein GCM10011408_02390 [Dyella caseinilytica]|nr:hypothetical protein GCM10011408_02390 [Dyella caseinilytica]
MESRDFCEANTHSDVYLREHTLVPTGSDKGGLLSSRLPRDLARLDIDAQIPDALRQSFARVRLLY